MRSAMGERRFTRVSPSVGDGILTCAKQMRIPPCVPHRSVWKSRLARGEDAMDVVSTLPQVSGEVVYLAKTGERPHTYTYDPPAGGAKSQIVNGADTVPVFDRRAVAGGGDPDEPGVG